MPTVEEPIVAESVNESEHEAPDVARPSMFMAGLRWLWMRYSPHGEFPISTAASTAFHMLVLALIPLFAYLAMAKPDIQPAVDVIRVGVEPNAAPGMGDGEAPEGTLEQGSTELAEPAAAPEPVAIEDVKDVDPAKVKENVVVNGTRPVDLASDSKQTDDLRDALRRAKERLNNNLAGNGGQKGLPGGKGTGGGGGTAPTGRAARPARWILHFNFQSIDHYLRQQEALGATIGFPAQGDNWTFFPKPASDRKRKETRNIDNENRLYWEDSNANTVRQVAQALGVPVAPFMLTFLPVELENRMLQLELQYRNLEEDEILSTVFQVVPRGGGYDVVVESQTPK